MRKLVLSLPFVLAAALPLAGTALADDEVNVSTGATIAGPGLAVHGYDVVAFFTNGAPMLGDDRFATVHENATYRFASQANLDAFQADPSRYAPAYGGFCAYGVSVGKKFDGDPRYWKIVDGRLYLNLNRDIQENWLEDVAGNIRKAENKWAEIRNTAAKGL
jgi:hypothetical protein